MVSYEELHEIEVENVFQEPLLFQGGDNNDIEAENNTHISVVSHEVMPSDQPSCYSEAVLTMKARQT